MEKDKTTEELKKHTKLLEEILRDTKKTKSYIVWLRFLWVLKMVIIVAPIILAIIYVPPQMKKIIHFFQQELQEYQESINNLK